MNYDFVVRVETSDKIRLTVRISFVFCSTRPIEMRIFVLNMVEIWKDIEGYEGYYQVSNIGNVKSLDRLTTHSRRIKGGLLYKDLRCNGYYFVNLYRGQVKYSQTIHRLVALAFIPNLLNKPQINHLNSIRTDNRVENLEWCTNSENQKHAYKFGFQVSVKGNLGYTGIRSKNANKINQLSKNNEFIRSFYGASEAQRITGIKASNIYKALKNKRLNVGGFKWELSTEK